MENNLKKQIATLLVVSIFFSSIFGAVFGFWAGTMANYGKINFKEFFKEMVAGKPPFANSNDQPGKVVTVDQESAVINAVEKVSPAVVSIIVSKDLPKIERFQTQSPQSDFFQQFFGDNFFNMPQYEYRQNGTEKKEIGGGSGFIISKDGMVLTNKHVVSEDGAEYTILTNDEKKYPAKILAIDPVNDLAVLKIEEKKRFSDFRVRR